MRKKFMVKAAEGEGIKTAKKHKDKIKDTIGTAKGYVKEFLGLNSAEDKATTDYKKYLGQGKAPPQGSSKDKSKVPSKNFRRMPTEEDEDPKYKLELLSTGGSVSRGNGIAIRGTKFKGVF
jgi:hypothetical protein